MRTKTITRAYQLQILPNFQKLEDVRYSASRYRLYRQHFVTQLYFKPFQRFFSTKGMGKLANQAQKQAMGVIAAHRAATKANGDKSNCPQVNFESCSKGTGEPSQGNQPPERSPARRSLVGQVESI
jgi:hypothetical protein